MPDRGVRGLVEGFLAGTAPGAAIGVRHGSGMAQCAGRHQSQ
jgi:hypothetical protein